MLEVTREMRISTENYDWHFDPEGGEWVATHKKDTNGTEFFYDPAIAELMDSIANDRSSHTSQ